ncbi:type IV pilus modification protein PilV [Marichromatium sp. AB32]|uniref:type IV pilus modification protein PilV n=1 Tax=Marichromatium sp. AB32 TaxID=2483363 RepID=UPI000F3AE2D9|nr:type IV pilus modification protein PilV [Marichromatium sp. AB32]RNE91365.1 type IV pilus modification protein PilV [Marichromatium sp. AB32]
MARYPRIGRRQRGLTLIEVLVTMVVLAVGLLGFGALQALTMKSNLGALQRSYATLHAHDIIESMRANRAERASYATGFTDSVSGTSVSAQDLQRWKQALAADLPSGEGRITLDGDKVAITLRWRETRLPTSAETDPTLEWVSFATETLLPEPTP